MLTAISLNISNDAKLLEALRLACSLARQHLVPVQFHWNGTTFNVNWSSVPSQVFKNYHDRLDAIADRPLHAKTNNYVRFPKSF